MQTGLELAVSFKTWTLGFEKPWLQVFLMHDLARMSSLIQGLDFRNRKTLITGCYKGSKDPKQHYQPQLNHDQSQTMD